MEIYSQENEIGINIGFGKTTIDEYGETFVLPFDNELPNYFRLGFCYYYTPRNAIFTLKSGIDYDYKGQNETRLNYLRTPLGLDFNFGRKVQFILGGGLFASYLIAYRGISNDSDFEDSKRRFQIGWYGNLGFGVQISQKYNLSIKYQYNADITKMYKNRRTSPGGAPYALDEKGYDGFIILCLKIKLTKQ